MSIYSYIYVAGAIPQMNLILLSGLWKTPEDVYRLRNSTAWAELEAKLEAYGIKTLCWIQIAGGVSSKSKQINLPVDLSQQEVRGAGKMLAALQNAGASTASMASSEAYSAMQLGLLDGLWTSSGALESYRMFEVSKYYNSPEDYRILYAIEPITISMKTWNKLTPAQQKIMTKHVQPWVLFVNISLLLIFLRCVMETIAIIVVTMPVLVPVEQAYHWNLI